MEIIPGTEAGMHRHIVSVYFYDHSASAAVYAVRKRSVSAGGSGLDAAFVLMADRLPVSGRYAVIPILAAGILCCGGLEFFNRYRMHMYNTLLEQYKKRKKI